MNFFFTNNLIKYSYRKEVRMEKDKSIIYRASLIIGLVIFVISFTFRYSYIDILGFDRPLKLASFIGTNR